MTKTFGPAARSYRTLPELRVCSPESAIEFVNERGFIHFWPIKGVTLPSLWAAVAQALPPLGRSDAAV